MEDIEGDGKKAALEHILRKFVPKAKKVSVMKRMNPEADYSKEYEEEEEPQDMQKLEDSVGDDELVDKILAKLGAKGQFKSDEME